MAPVRVSDPSQVPQALVRWDAAHERYIEAGGAQVSEARKVGAIMRTLPAAIHDKALWDIEQFKDSPEALRKWLTQKTRNVTRGGYDGDKKQVNSLLEEYEELPEGLQDEIHALGEVPEEVICAFVKKRMANFRRTGDRSKPTAQSPGPRPDAREAPPRDARDVRCSNCGEKGHAGKDCKQPRRDPKDRPCFKCGQMGHMSRFCPNAQTQKAMAVGDSSPTPVESINCMADEDYVPVHRRGKHSRRPPAVRFAEAYGCSHQGCGCEQSAFIAMSRHEVVEPSVEDGDNEDGKPGTMSNDTQPSKRTWAKVVADSYASGRLHIAGSAKANGECSVGHPLNKEPYNDQPPSLRNLNVVSAVKMESGEPSESPLKSRAAKLLRSRDPPELDLSDDEDEPVNHRGAPPEGYGHRMQWRRAKLVDAETEETVSKPEPGRWLKKIVSTDSKVQSVVKDLMETHRKDPPQVINLFESIPDQLNSLPQVQEPEYLDIEFTLDTGASVHAIDALDLPGFTIRESAGSRRKQNFQAAGGKLIPNEGETDVFFLSNATDGPCELMACMQIAKVTRPLLSVSKITEGNRLKVLCDHEAAYIMNLQGKVLARFGRNGGLYTAVLKVKNPKFKPFTRPAP